MTREDMWSALQAAMPASGAAVIAVSDSEAEISKPRATGLPRSGKRLNGFDARMFRGATEITRRWSAG